MKKLILPLLLLTYSMSMAQSRKGLTISPSVTVSAAVADGYYNIDPMTQLELKTDIGGSMTSGIDVGYMFNNKLGLFSGIGYRFTTLTFTDYSWTLNQEQIGITQPLYFRWVSSQFGRKGLALNAGIHATYMYKGTVLSGGSSYKNIHEINSPQIDIFINPNLNLPAGRTGISVDLGVFASIQLNNNYNYPLSSKIFYAGIRIAHNFRVKI